MYFSCGKISRLVKKRSKDGDTQKLEMGSGCEKTVLFYDQGNFAYTVDAVEKNVTAIQISKSGYKVAFENIDISIGDHASKVLKQLGKSHGFERERMGHSGYKEMLKYNEYGLSFGTNPQDEIISMVVWKLE